MYILFCLPYPSYSDNVSFKYVLRQIFIIHSVLFLQNLETDDLIEFLISKGADVNTREKVNQKTPLHMCAASGKSLSILVAKILLRKSKFIFNDLLF